MNRKKLQEEEYSFPYHYVSSYKDGFTQTYNDAWGLNYITTISYLLERIKEENVSSIIDLGCGDGRFTRELSESFPKSKLVGVDYSEKAVRYAKAFNANVLFECSDIRTYKKNEKYDLAVLMEVVEHIPQKDCRILFKKVSELLSSNGLIYLTVPHVNKPLEHKHYQHFTLESISDVMQEYFTIIDVVPFEKRSIFRNLINTVLTNKYFILNHQPTKDVIYKFYLKYLFFCDQKVCQRMFVKARLKRNV